MSLSSELSAARGASELLAAQVRAAGQRHVDAAILVSSSADQLNQVWVSPQSDYLQPQLHHLRTMVAPVGAALAELAQSLVALARVATDLAAQARIWEQKLQEAQAELGRRSIGEQIGEALFGGNEAAFQVRIAQAALDDIREQWNSACRSRYGMVQSVGGPLEQLANTSVLLPVWDDTPVWASDYQMQLALLYTHLRGDAPTGVGSSNWLESGAEHWMWWQDQPVHTGWDWISYLGWIRSGSSSSSFPTIANGLIARHLLGGTQIAPWLTLPAVQTGARLFPLAGGIYTASTATWRVAGAGLPHNALRDQGAGYTSDVGLVAFGGGVTILAVGGFVVLSPVWATTGTFMVVGGGLVWGGSKVVEHWDTISGGAVQVWDWTTDAGGWALDQGGWVLQQGADGLGWVADQGAAGVGWAWDEGSDLVGDVVHGGSVILGGAGDLAGSAWDNTLGRLF